MTDRNIQTEDTRLLKYREQHKHRLNYMPWLYWSLKPKNRGWADEWQKEYQAYLMDMETEPYRVCR